MTGVIYCGTPRRTGKSFISEAMAKMAMAAAESMGPPWESAWEPSYAQVLVELQDVDGVEHADALRRSLKDIREVLGASMIDSARDLPKENKLFNALGRLPAQFLRATGPNLDAEALTSTWSARHATVLAEALRRKVSLEEAADILDADERAKRLEREAERAPPPRKTRAPRRAASLKGEVAAQEEAEALQAALDLEEGVAALGWGSF